MTTADVAAPAAERTLPPGADIQPVRRRRLERGWTLAELGARVGLSESFLSAVELDQKRPSVEVGHRIAAELAVSVDDLGWKVKACECSPDCEALTFGAYAARHELGAIAARNRALDREKLAAYKARYKLLGTPELAEKIGVSDSLVTLWVRDGKLKSRRYPGRWSEQRRPLLFGLPEIAAAELLASTSTERRSAAVSAGIRRRWEQGLRPRREFIRRPCARAGCDQLALFNSPWELTWRKGYCSRSCAALDRWRRGVGLERFVRMLPSRVRQRWLGRWGGATPKAGRGRPRGYTDEQATRVLELRASGLSFRAIERITGRSKWQVEDIVARAKVSGKPF